MIMNSEQVRIRKEPILACNRALSWHLSGETGKQQKGQDSQ